MPFMGFKIIAGNFPKNNNIYFNREDGKYVLKENSIFGKNYHIQANISAIELVTEQNKNSFLGKVGWGIAGSLALGPLGAAAGVLSGGTGKEMCCAIEMYPKYKFVAALDVKAYVELQPIAKRNAAAGKILPDTDILRQQVPVSVAPAPAPAPTVVAAPQPKKKSMDINDLPKLKKLLDEGIITQEEFNAAKKKALGL